MRTVNAARLLGDLKALAEIGKTSDGGVSRVAFSVEDELGRNWFRKRAEECGLVYSCDGAGNQSATLFSNPPSPKRVVFGSHLDSVPNGGRYDGALGTLAALEALRCLKESGYTPPVSLEVMNFTSEENVILLMMGSRAVAGLLREEDLGRAKMDPVLFDQRLSALGIDRKSILAARRNDIAAWLELHIEQATVLEKSGIDIGVVTAIVGIRNFRLTFTGEAAHAGTKPLAERKDALWGAAQFILRAKDLILGKFSPGTINFGQLKVEPGASNIVPALVTLDMEFRNGSPDVLKQMEQELFALFEETGSEFSLKTSHQPVPSTEPCEMSETVVRAIEKAADACGLTHTRLLSFAGHDTQSMSRIAPSAMFFVPSVNGVSHSPEEFTADQDCVNGANVLLNAIPALAEELAA